MATVKQSERTFWHKRATTTLKTALAMQDVSYKDLSRRLAAFGEDEPEKTLSNKINRGSFSFLFFMKCLYALGQREFRLELPTIPPAELAKLMARKKTPTKRKPPVRKKAEAAK